MAADVAWTAADWDLVLVLPLPEELEEAANKKQAEEEAERALLTRPAPTRN